MTKKPSLHYVNFSIFIKLIEKLHAQISNNEIKYDYIISLQRGGALMSLIMSDLLSLPIATLTISSYKNAKKIRKAILTQPISVDIKNKNVIILDEICDTGETLQVATDYLNNKNPKTIHTATFFTKTHAKFKPTFNVEINDKWIVFPYEINETYNSDLVEDITTKKEIDNFFLKCGYTKGFIKQNENSK